MYDVRTFVILIYFFSFFKLITAKESSIKDDRTILLARDSSSIQIRIFWSLTGKN